MKCFYHETTDAVATCQSCGKSLCKSCAEKYRPCRCEECHAENEQAAEDRRKKSKEDALIDTGREFIGAIIKGLIASFVLSWLIGTWSGTPVDLTMRIFFFFVPFGWAVITYIEQWLPGFWMSGAVFIVYLCIKLALSIMLGVPCFLYQIVKFGVGIYRARKI